MVYRLFGLFNFNLDITRFAGGGSSFGENVASPASLYPRRELVSAAAQFFRGYLERACDVEQHVLRFRLALWIEDGLELCGDGAPDPVGQFGVARPEEDCSTLEFVTLDRFGKQGPVSGEVDPVDHEQSGIV